MPGQGVVCAREVAQSSRAGAGALGNEGATSACETADCAGLHELDGYRSFGIKDKAGAAARDANELVNRGRRKQQFKQIASSVASSYHNAVPRRRVAARFENLGVDGIFTGIRSENRSQNDLGLRSSHKPSGLF